MGFSKGLREKWKNWKIKYQLLCMIFITAMFAIVIGMLSYHYSARMYIRENNEKYINETARRITENIEDYQAQISTLAVNVAYSSEIQNLLLGEQYMNQSEVYAYLLGMITNVDGVNAVSVFDLDEKGYYGYRHGKMNLTYNVSKQKWNDELRNRLQGIYVQMDQENEPIIYPNEEYLEYIMPIRSLHTLQMIGILVCQINANKFASLLDSRMACFDIYTDNGIQLLKDTSKDGELFQKIYKSVENTGESSDYYKVGNVKYYVTYLKTKRNNWKVISITNSKILVDDMSGFFKNTLITIVILLLIITSYTYILLKNMNKSIGKLNNGTEAIQNGNFGVQIQIYQNREFNELASKFNKMSLQLQKLMKDIQDKEKQKRELELEALSYQISPHFLFNTLSTVKYMAMLQKASNIEYVIENLVFMLEQTVRKESVLITVGEELELLHSYIAIMKIRYMNQIEVKYDVDQKIMDCICINMMLQPIVENSIFYGSAGHTAKTIIKISGRREETEIRLSVWNNGQQIPADKLENLLDEEVPMKSIGIRNTNRRIKMEFGEEYGLTITSDSKNGTETVITIPYRKKEEI